MTRPPLSQPVSSSTAEHTDRNSRFIAWAVRVETATEAKLSLQKIRAAHSDATHVVYAFRVGGHARDECGSSDDGEPKGTAGRPVLEVLRGAELSNVLIAVVRYYGGTKLGTGGLVRAYTTAAQLVVGRLKTECIEQRVTLAFRAPYDLYPPIRRFLDDRSEQGVRVESEVFDVAVSLEVSTQDRYEDELRARIQDVSRGTIEVQRLP